MKEQRPYHATAAELRAIDEALKEEPINVGSVSLGRLHRSRPLGSTAAKRLLAGYIGAPVAALCPVPHEIERTGTRTASSLVGVEYQRTCSIFKLPVGSARRSSASFPVSSSQADQSEHSNTTICRSWIAATSGPG